MRDRLLAGQQLNTGDTLVSSNGKVRLVLQSDGNLVLYRQDSGRALWASRTSGEPVSRATMQGDGNFVCYDSAGRARWSTGTWRFPGSLLVLQDDGNLCLYDASGVHRWGSNTPQDWNKSRFHVEIKTADEADAGTDSNIFLILYGEYGQSREIRLNSLIGHDAFERGSTERVDLTDIPRMGRIFKVRVRSDTHYWASDWRLSRISVTPREPEFPSSTFYWEDWITDTGPKDLYVDGWPWSLDLYGAEPDTAVRRQITMMNLIDSDQTLTQTYTVGYELQEQVTVSTEITDTAKLNTRVKWEPPESLIGKGLTVEVANEWDKVLKTQRVDQSSEKLVTQDTRAVTFPAHRLTFVVADWTELWRKAVATLGSTSVGIRWLYSAPSSPSWTLASFAPGDLVGEPYASYLRKQHPELATQFVLTPPVPTPGRWYSLTAKHSGKCLEVGGGATQDGAGANQWEWLGLPHQMWAFHELEPGVYEITARHSGKSLDVSGGSVEDGARVQQWTWWGGNNEKWRLTPQPDGMFTLSAVHSGKFLDVGGESKDNGAVVQQWTWWGGNNQKWCIEDRD